MHNLSTQACSSRCEQTQQPRGGEKQNNGAMAFEASGAASGGDRREHPARPLFPPMARRPRLQPLSTTTTLPELRVAPCRRRNFVAVHQPALSVAGLLGPPLLNGGRGKHGAKGGPAGSHPLFPRFRLSGPSHSLGEIRWLRVFSRPSFLFLFLSFSGRGSITFLHAN